MKTIAINCLGVDGGGGKTYFEHFLPALENISKDFRYFVFIRESLLGSIPVAGENVTYIPVSLPPGTLNRFLKEQLWIPNWLKKNKIDLLFSPADSTALLSPCPVVLAMRNLNLYVERDKGWSLPFQMKFHALSLFARFSSSIARRIIFVSDTSRKIISNRLKIPEEKQRVIYHGLSPRFLEPSTFPAGEFQVFTEKTPYILTVSSIYRYKNFIRLIESFAKARSKVSRDYHLVIAGKPYDIPYYRQMNESIAAHNLESRIHLLGEVSYSVLPALYRQARLFAFPSYLETFGHPLVEAMASGVPIIAADIENSREITGNSALFFPPKNTEILSEQLISGLENESLRMKLIEKGLERVKTFSWKRCAEETLSVFQEALS